MTLVPSWTVCPLKVQDWPVTAYDTTSVCGELSAEGSARATVQEVDPAVERASRETVREAPAPAGNGCEEEAPPGESVPELGETWHQDAEAAAVQLDAVPPVLPSVNVWGAGAVAAVAVNESEEGESVRWAGAALALTVTDAEQGVEPPAPVKVAV